MTDETPKTNFRPSASTVASGLGGMPIAIIIVWAVRQFWSIEIPGEVAAAIGSVIGALIGYIPSSGRSA